MKQRTTVIVIFSLLIVFFCVLIFRLVHLQLKPHEAALRTRQQYAVLKEKPQRGVIVDSRSRILAASNRVDNVFADPKIVKDARQIASQLQEILNYPGHEICRIIDESKSPRFIKIIEGITPDQRDRIFSARLPGIGIQSVWQRYYPTGSLMSHVIGFVGSDQNALAGIELKYDSYLKGSEGENVLFVNSMRQPIGFKASDNIVNDGYGLILTIDASIQQFVKQALLKQFKAYNAESAMGIVMEPKTGAVLSLVSLPDFDPDNIAEQQPENLKNTALTDPFEPGSIFKPIVAAIALDAGVIDFDEVIYCEMGDYHGKGFGKIGEFGNHKYGDLSIKGILTHSSNIGMAKIGQKMERQNQRQKLYDGLKLFGFGAKTDIDLPGEESGMLHPTKTWDGYSITRIPFGHEITVTAIQIAQAYATLANHGRIVNPYLLRATVDSSGNVSLLKRKTPSAGFIIDPKVADWIVKDALVNVVKEGTGTRAALKKWQVFGKTGTANIAGDKKEGYDQTNYVSSFAGGAPVEDPRLIVVVSIIKPDRSLGKGYSGGRVAAPVVKEILENSLTYLQQQ